MHHQGSSEKRWLMNTYCGLKFDLQRLEHEKTKQLYPRARHYQEFFRRLDGQYLLCSQYSFNIHQAQQHQKQAQRSKVGYHQGVQDIIDGDYLLCPVICSPFIKHWSTKTEGAWNKVLSRVQEIEWVKVTYCILLIPLCPWGTNTQNNKVGCIGVLSRVLHKREWEEILTMFPTFILYSPSPKQKHNTRSTLEQRIIKCSARKKEEMRVLTPFQTSSTPLQAQKPKTKTKGSLEKGIIKRPRKTDEKKSTYFLPTLIHFVNKQRIQGSLKKGIIKSPHRKTRWR